MAFGVNQKLNLMSKATVGAVKKRVAAFFVALTLGSFSLLAANSAMQLAFTTQPPSTVVGAAITNVVVQLKDKTGTNAVQSGVVISLALNRGGGLAGITNATTDATGKAAFTNLKISTAINGISLVASATGLKSASSSAFNISKGSTVTTLAASTNVLIYGQNITFTATVTAAVPASGLATGTITFKDGSTILGTAALNASGIATFTTNRISAVTASHTLTALYGGDTNFLASTSGNFSLSVGKLALTVSGIIASNKIYDGTTAATLNVSNAVLSTAFAGDLVTLNVSAAKGAFADKTVGNNKTIAVTGLTIAGTNVGNYSLMPPPTTASITPRSLTITVKGVNKIYNAATNATVTLADNRLSGDVLADNYASASFTTKNIGTAILINVSGLAITGMDSTNYVLSATTATATANITAFPLTVPGVVANNKIYDAMRTVTLNLSNAALAKVFSGDTVTLNTSAALGTFANKNVGTNKAVTISGLALAGASAGNYTLIQPTTTANIAPRSLSITATGVNKIYNGITNATVALTDNRMAGDLVTDSYAAAGFISPSVGTNILVNVYGLTIAGTDAGNYNLAATNTATMANISPAMLVVTATTLSRPYATTNPVLSWLVSGFVAGESLTNSDVTGVPTLATTAKTNSVVGTYTITIAKGTLASLNYKFTFVNGVLTVTKADTTALLTTTINPARTNQNVTFAATVNPLARTVLPATGLIQFKCNGTNKLGSAVSLNNSAANLTVIAANLGQNNAVITAEYSDPAGNFNPSTNSIVQTVLTVVVPPPPCQLSLGQNFHGGNVGAQIAGVSGQTYIIEASADLIHWLPLSTNVADTNGIVSLIDSNAVAFFPSRFYRAYTP